MKIARRRRVGSSRDCAPASRRAIELSPGDGEAAKLRSIAQSRTEPASRVERARILLAFCNGPWFVNPSFPLSEGSFRRVVLLSGVGAQGRHLMGFERGWVGQSIVGVVYANRQQCDLAQSVVPASGPRFGRLVS